MEVACGKCGARGRVPDAQLASGPVAVRCSACGGVMKLGDAFERAPALRGGTHQSARADAWYLDTGQGAQGPYKIEELVALWRGDKISWNAKLWRDGDPEWSPARGHGAFIDAIFAHDERSANAGANTAASGAPVGPGVPLPPAERAVRPGTHLPPVPQARPGSERTSPAYRPAAPPAPAPAHEAPERTPHDSLAPFERVARVAGRRWPYAIVPGSAAIAAGALIYALNLPPAAPTTAPAAVAQSAVAPAPETAAQPQRAAAAAPAGAIDAPFVPAAEPDVARAEAELGPARPLAAHAPAVIPVAAAKPLTAVPPAGAVLPAAGTRPGRLPAAVPPSDGMDEAEPADDEAEAESAAEPAVASASEPEPAAAAPSRTPDFLTAAAPLPDMPTTREIASAMRKVAPAVRACAESNSPNTVYVTVAITGATGRVARVQVPQASGRLQSCIASAVRGAAFPAFDRPELELRFPFLLGQ